jgi:ADP-ribose pyrophosphatase
MELNGLETTARPVAAVSVAAFLGREILLVKRGQAPYAGAWSLPGGAIRWGETAEEAACRELKEETSLSAFALTLADIADVIIRNEYEEAVAHYMIAVFCTQEVTGDLLAGTDAAEARWFSPEELPSIGLTPALEAIITKAEQALSKEAI